LFKKNQANRGGAIACTGAGGVNIFNGDFSYNQVANLVYPYGNEFTAGGAITVSGGCNLHITDSNFDHNQAIGSGAAVFVDTGSTANIEQNTIYANQTYENLQVSQLGQVHGGTIASRQANLIVRRNSFDLNKSEHGTILVWKTLDTSLGGVHIGNNMFRGANGTSNQVTDVDRGTFPWSIVSTFGLTTGTGAIELRDITSAFWANNHDVVVHNTIYSSLLSEWDIFAQNSDALIGNNALVYGTWNLRNGLCKFFNVRQGQIRGNVEDLPYSGQKTCVDSMGNGSALQNPLLQIKKIGYLNRFIIAFPTLYLSNPHPGSFMVDNTVEESNIWDQRGYARDLAMDPYLPGALVRESWN